MIISASEAEEIAIEIAERIVDGFIKTPEPMFLSEQIKQAVLSAYAQGLTEQELSDRAVVPGG